MFLAIAVDNLANAQELTAAEEEQEEEEKEVSAPVSSVQPNVCITVDKIVLILTNSCVSSLV